MHARSCGELRGRRLDIETAWMHKFVERHRWGKTLDFETRCMQEIVETIWAQEVVEKAAGKYRYWNPMNSGSLGSLMRGTWGEVRYWHQMSAGSYWETGEAEILKPNGCRKLLRGTGVQGKFGYWNDINARSCGEANAGKPTYETKWMQEVVEGHRGEFWILKQDGRNKCREAGVEA